MLQMFSLYCLPFLRFRRRRSQFQSKPPLETPLEDAAIVHPFHPFPPASPLQPLSTFDTPEQDVNVVTTTTSRPSAPRNPDDLGGQASWESQSTTQIGVADPVSSQARSSFILAVQPTSPSPANDNPNPTHSTWHCQQSSIPQHPPHPFITSSQPSSERLTQSSSQYSGQQRYQNQGIFSHAHDFTVVRPTLIDGNSGNITIIGTPSDQFMEKLLDKTIHGAAFDSSARDPPPRCHPGTRLEILERCLYFIANCNGERKVRWVVGAAGVGKSAIMQNVVESPKLSVSYHASVFFSTNGRNDGTKTIVTLSYQIAAKSEPYRQVIEYEITRDPSLLESSLPVQFKKLIVEPFCHHSQFDSTGRVLIVIDGLDECKNSYTQQELLRLICDFCIEYPSSPIVWLIASRPETHINSFFSRADVVLAYEKEEIPVNSDESRADVERFLRDELNQIKEGSDSLGSRSKWPDEKDLWKLAHASGGLFAYAHTVTRYIGDSNVGNPVSQLSDVLNIIDHHPMTDITREDHPLALLDALYAQILSTVPPKIMIYTRKLLLALASDWHSVLWFPGERNFVVLCNWLGITRDEAYAAVNHLHSVLRIPRRDKSHEEELEPFHKSFMDYISDSTRSGFSPDVQHEAQQLKAQCAFRILQEAPDGINFGEADYTFSYGVMRRGPGTGDKISLTWPADEGAGWKDDEMRLSTYKLTIGEIAAGVERGDPTFQSDFCVRFLVTQFEEYYGNFPHYALHDLVFSKARRDEFKKSGILKEFPLKGVNISDVVYEINVRYLRPAATVTHSPDPRHSPCQHEQGVQGNDRDWTTSFWPGRCTSCTERLERQLGDWKSRSPDLTCLVLFTSAGQCCVELQFVYPEDDGMGVPSNVGFGESLLNKLNKA